MTRKRKSSKKLLVSGNRACCGFPHYFRQPRRRSYRPGEPALPVVVREIATPLTGVPIEVLRLRSGQRLRSIRLRQIRPKAVFRHRTAINKTVAFTLVFSGIISSRSSERTWSFHLTVIVISSRFWPLIGTDKARRAFLVVSAAVVFPNGSRKRKKPWHRWCRLPSDRPSLR